MARIMIADDSRNVRILIHEIIVMNGHEVVASTDNGADTLEMFFRCQPDLLITDYKMPIMDGLEVISHILHQDKQANIIMCTANPEEVTVIAKQLGVFDIIPKPFDNEQLILSISNALEIIRGGVDL